MALSARHAAFSAFAFIVAAITASSAHADGFGTFSEGYRMGQLVKFSEKGMILRSGEGELLLGNESTPLMVQKTVPCSSSGKHSHTCTRQVEVNPWKFSVDLKDQPLIQKLNANNGEYVVMKYKQSIIQNPFTNDTSYVITDVEPVNRKATSAKCEAKHKADGAKSDGTRIGRIVKIGYRGNILKSWEVQMQVGNSGSKFISMSVSEEELAKCLTENYLKTGAKIKLTYNQSYLRNPLARDTNYDILSAEPAAKGLD